MLYHQCSYCHKELAPAEQTADDGVQISHGICRSCLEKMLAGSGESLANFLDSIPLPVFIVDHAARVLAVNAAGRKVVGKGEAQILGLSGGEVFQCAEALLPGGCGNRLLCRSCVIRNAVMATYRDGQAREKLPAFHELDLICGVREARFLISTEKVGGVVLLKIDEILLEETDLHLS